MLSKGYRSPIVFRCQTLDKQYSWFAECVLCNLLTLFMAIWQSWSHSTINEQHEGSSHPQLLQWTSWWIPKLTVVLVRGYIRRVSDVRIAYQKTKHPQLRHRLLSSDIFRSKGTTSRLLKWIQWHPKSWSCVFFNFSYEQLKWLWLGWCWSFWPSACSLLT